MPVRFPHMRFNAYDVICDLEAMRAHGPAWERIPPSIATITFCVNILDDCGLFDEDLVAHEIVHPDEVPLMRNLAVILLRLIDVHGENPDLDYLNDPRWLDLEQAATAVRRRMETNCVHVDGRTPR